MIQHYDTCPQPLPAKTWHYWGVLRSYCAFCDYRGQENE